MTTPEHVEANRDLSRLSRLFLLVQVSTGSLLLVLVGLVYFRVPYLTVWAGVGFLSVSLTGVAGFRLFRLLLRQTQGCHRTLIECADQQDLLRAILDHAADGIFLCDEGGHIS